MSVSVETGGIPHIKVRYVDGGSLLERCEDPGCTVDSNGHAGCGRQACPGCGSSSPEIHSGGDVMFVACGCGYLAAQH